MKDQLNVEVDDLTNVKRLIKTMKEITQSLEHNVARPVVSLRDHAKFQHFPGLTGLVHLHNVVGQCTPHRHMITGFAEVELQAISMRTGNTVERLQELANIDMTRAIAPQLSNLSPEDEEPVLVELPQFKMELPQGVLNEKSSS